MRLSCPLSVNHKLSLIAALFGSRGAGIVGRRHGYNSRRNGKFAKIGCISMGCDAVARRVPRGSGAKLDCRIARHSWHPPAACVENNLRCLWRTFAVQTTNSIRLRTTNRHEAQRSLGALLTFIPAS